MRVVSIRHYRTATSSDTCTKYYLCGMLWNINRLFQVSDPLADQDKTLLLSLWSICSAGQ